MSEWEKYWRAGYQVVGSHPVTVNKYARTKKRAEEEAMHAASEAIRHLKAIGIQAEVRLWTESWRTRRVEESDGLVNFHTIKVDRADKEIVQARYEDSLAKGAIEASA